MELRDPGAIEEITDNSRGDDVVIDERRDESWVSP
jgi:hypothetical protein